MGLVTPAHLVTITVPQCCRRRTFGLKIGRRRAIVTAERAGNIFARRPLTNTL
jgi:hypothetical protein